MYNVYLLETNYQFHRQSNNLTLKMRHSLATAILKKSILVHIVRNGPEYKQVGS